MVLPHGFYLAFVTVVTAWYFCSGVAPSFKYESQEQSYWEKNGTVEIRLKCIVEADTGRYRWSKDGRELFDNSKYRVKKFRYLKIRNLVFADQGRYKCAAWNVDGNISRFFNLNVEGITRNMNASGRAPKFKDPESIREQREQLVSVGNAASFSCNTEGRPTPSIYWFKDTKLISSSSDHFSFDVYTMKIKSSEVTDMGNYRCVVWNYYGSINANFSLKTKDKIRSKPVLQSAQNLSGIVGSDVEVMCDAVDQDQPEFKLYKIVNGRQIRIDQNIRVRIVDAGSHGGNVRWWRAVWKLFNVSFDDQMFYTCTAGNLIGANEQSFFITVLSKQTAPPPSSTPTSLKERSDYKETVIIIVVVVIPSVCFIAFVFLLCAFIRRRMRRGKADLTFAAKTDMLLHVTPNPTSNVPPTRPKQRVRLQSNLSQTSEIAVPYDEEWEISRENIRLLEVIGEGAFGKVLKAEVHDLTYLNTVKSTVAVKTLKDDATDVEFADLVSELEVMKTIGPHKNIINLVGCCTQQNEALFVVVEYALYGSLRDFLRDRRPNRQGVCNVQYVGVEDVLTLRDFVSFSYQVARGMDYLASMKCIHRDLAARNVLVSEDRVMKIADFGLARDIHKIDYYRKTTDGRLPVKWMALEALFDRVYTTQSDVWAFGILTWEIFTFGGTPYPSVPLEKLFELLKSGYRMERPVNCPPELYDLLLRCWLEDPNSRPNFTDVVKELNAELESMTSEEYIDVQLPLLSPLTPRNPSESEPHRGMTTVRDSFCSNVFDSEENEQAVGDDAELLARKAEEKGCDSGGDDPVESPGDASEPSQVLINPSDGTLKFRSRKESHV